MRGPGNGLGENSLVYTNCALFMQLIISSLAHRGGGWEKGCGKFVFFVYHLLTFPCSVT